MITEGPIVLFGFGSAAEFNELRRVARVVRDICHFEAVFLFEGPLYQLPDNAAAESDQWVFTDWSGRAEVDRQRVTTDTGKGASANPGRKKVNSGLVVEWLKTGKSIVNMWRQLSLARQAVARIKPTVLVVPADGLGGPLPLIRAAREKGIPTVIVPYEYSSFDQQRLYVTSKPRADRFLGLNGLINRLTARFYPQWVRRIDGRERLRLFGPLALAHEWLGLAPPNPWTVHGGRADFLLAESTAMMSHYRREGLREDKLRLTGTVYDDIRVNLMKTRSLERRKLTEHYRLPERGPLVLCSIPPNQWSLGSAEEFDSYHDLISFWMDALTAQERWRVIFQFHPRVSITDIEKFASRSVVVDRDIAWLIPLVDLFVTSVSSVIRQAVAAGIPVVNYDVYGYRYSDYREVGGVIGVQTKDEFLRELEKLHSAPGYIHEVSNKQRQCAAEWGTSDGRATQRIRRVFEELTGNL